MADLVRFTAAVIDQRLRAKKAAANPDAIDVTMFEEKSPWPYLGFAVLCGAFPLPLYFYSK